VIEDSSSGTAVIQELRRQTGLPILAVPARSSKIARAEAITPYFESGRVLLPERAPWIESFITEFCSFPAGRHDDMLDAAALAIQTLLEQSGRVAQAINYRPVFMSDFPR
jgi:predicted phage terminase large subunit-like protein